MTFPVRSNIRQRELVVPWSMEAKKEGDMEYSRTGERESLEIKGRPIEFETQAFASRIEFVQGKLDTIQQSIEKEKMNRSYKKLE